MQKQSLLQIQETTQPQLFQIYSSQTNKTTTLFKIYQDYINIQFNNRLINWKDILAINHHHQQHKLTKMILLLFQKQNKFLKGTVRSEQHIYFYILPQSVHKLEKSLRKFMTHSEIQSPKFLMFHNPQSGSNSAQKLRQGVQFLKKTHFKYEIITTVGKDHCKKYLLENKPTSKDYWGVAIFSGDGLVNQFINSKCDIPLVHVPAGSGNAVAKNLSVLANQNSGVKQSLFMGMKGLITTIPVMQIQLQKQQQKILCVLSVQWAFLADIDLESQFLRCLGTLRFQIYSVWRLMFLRTFRCKISFSESSNNLPSINEPITDPSFESYETDLYFFLIHLMPYTGQKYHSAPMIKIKDQVMDLQIVPRTCGRLTMTKYMLNFQKGTNFDMQKRKPKFNFQHKLIKAFRLEPLGEHRGKIGLDGEEIQPQMIQAKIIPNKLKVFTLY